MAKFTLDVNDAELEVDAAPGTSLLWVLREHLGLTGTKYGCGIAQCCVCQFHRQFPCQGLYSKGRCRGKRTED